MALVSGDIFQFASLTKNDPDLEDRLKKEMSPIKALKNPIFFTDS